MSLWPFAKKKPPTASEMTSERVASVQTNDRSDAKAAPLEQQEANPSSVVQEVADAVTTTIQKSSEKDDVKPIDLPDQKENLNEINDLAAMLMENPTLDREEFVKASAPLKKLAETDPYAAEQMKLIQREFFRKVRIRSEEDYRSQQEVLQFNALKDQLLNEALLSQWCNSKFDAEGSEEVNGWHGFSAEEAENYESGQELADFIYKNATSNQTISSKFSINTIGKASKESAAIFINAISTLMKFLVDRDAVLLPTMRRAIMTSKNKYGDSDYSGYFDEVIQFCSYSKSQLKDSVISEPVAFKIVSRYFLRRVYLETPADDQVENIPIDGFEFEIWCAEKIQSQGWSVEATPKSGDQGVDIVVRRGKTTVAVQCKRYQNPVGNSAVQEIHAGRTYVGANAAIVIATGGFTKSAQSLAAVSKVHLMDASDISKFSELFGFEADVIKPVLNEEFVSETYGQMKIVDMVFKGIDQMKDVVPEELNVTFKESFDQETGKGRYNFGTVDAMRILFCASAVLMSKLQLTEQHRLSLLGKGEDLNKGLISDLSIQEMFVYQIYNSDSNDLILDAFRDYATKFGILRDTFAYLQEFEDS